MQFTKLLFGVFAISLVLFSCKQDKVETSVDVNLQNTPVTANVSAGKVVLNQIGDVKIHTFISDDNAAANATHIIETQNALVIIDAQFLKTYSSAFRNYANSLKKPINRLIITHAHPDHFFGHAMSFNDVPTYALQSVANIIEQAGNQMIANQKGTFGDQIPNAVTPIKNIITAGQKETIDGVEYQYTNVTNAESEDELIIKLPGLKTMIVGDLIYSDVHLWLGFGKFDEWISALSTYVKGQGDYKVLLAGHGIPNTFNEVDDNINYLQTAKAKFKEANIKGESFKSYLVAQYPKLGSPIIIDLYLSFLFPGDDDILEIPVRQVPDETKWYNALTTLNQNLVNEKGIIANREFKSIFSVAPFNPATNQPYDKVFFGLGQYESQAAYDAIIKKYTTGTPPSWLSNYFTTNIPLTGNANILVKPYRNTPNLDVKNFLAAGQVLEIAIRDVSGYANFNDFDTKRAAFVNLLKKQNGFIKELEYRSADGKYYVGMSIYENAQKFQAIGSNPAIMQSAEATALFSAYPPMVNQFGLAYP